MDEATPVKLCECGCGRPTRISDRNCPEQGYLKGQPRRFVKGHARRNADVLPATRAKLSEGQAGQQGQQLAG